MDTTRVLNQPYFSPSMRRRYEVWFLRFALADGSGAWWFRYLLMNLGRSGCPFPGGEPAQVWATRFPANGPPQHFIQGFRKEELCLSRQGDPEFSLQVGENTIGSSSCHGHMRLQGHDIRWDLRYRSLFSSTLSNKGWIGFSRTPHSDALFSGSVSFDGVTSSGENLGRGLQGHNCGVRHRHFWTWMHAGLPNANRTASTIEALTYEMPLGLTFRKAILWHQGVARVFSRLRETTRTTSPFRWEFTAESRDGSSLEVRASGSSTSTHRLPYCKTDCSGSFEVANNSLADAHVRLHLLGQGTVELATTGGAVLEMTGTPRR